MIPLSWMNKAAAEAFHDMDIDTLSFSDLDLDSSISPCDETEITDIEGEIQVIQILVTPADGSGESTVVDTHLNGSGIGMGDDGNTYMVRVNGTLDMGCGNPDGCLVLHVSVRSREGQNFAVTVVLKTDADGNPTAQVINGTCQGVGRVEVDTE